MLKRMLGKIVRPLLTGISALTEYDIAVKRKSKIEIINSRLPYYSVIGWQENHVDLF